MVSAYHVLNNTNNETSFNELRIFFEGAFYIKVKEVYVLKYLNFRVCQSPFDFSVGKAYQII